MSEEENKEKSNVEKIDDAVEEATEAAAEAQTSSEEATEASTKAQTKFLEAATAATEAQAKSSEATIAATEAQAKSSETTDAYNEVNALLEQVKTLQKEMLTLAEQSRTSEVQTAEIARIADEKNDKVIEYQRELEELKTQFQSTASNIEDLLPAATGVGLAKAFNLRKKDLSLTIIMSAVGFTISILGFALLGYLSLQESSTIKTLEDFFLFSLERSPFIVGLILLEEFTRRQYNNTRKLEEDYAYKETLSIAFDGYKKAMSEIDDEEKESLSKEFSRNVLEMLNRRPGRLLESEDEQKINLDTLLPLTNLEQTSDGVQTKSLGKILTIFNKNFKDNLLKYSLTIIVAIIIGIVIGYSISSNNIPRDNHNETEVVQKKDKQ